MSTPKEERMLKLIQVAEKNVSGAPREHLEYITKLVIGIYATTAVVGPIDPESLSAMVQVTLLDAATLGLLNGVE